MDYSEKRERCRQYIEALEEERRKIHVFQRELPLCLNLVTQAIEAYKREIPETSMYGQSECSEQTTGECRPVLEQFLTIKDSSTTSNEEEHHEEFDIDEHGNHDPDKDSDDKNMKSDWLKSVQLWNQPEILLPKEEMMETVKRDESIRTDDHSMTSGGDGRKKEAEKDGGGGGGEKKQRRCWSSHLHRRFVNALQHLGGPHVATPKQIRELMKVDGLTNDEVKSHLQKYRLHKRRPSQTIPNNNGNSQTQQFVIVGSSWVPRPYYSTGNITGGATTSSTTTTTGTYGAMAAPQAPQWPIHSNFRPSVIVEEQSASHSTEEKVVRCSSPAMSSSIRNHYVNKI